MNILLSSVGRRVELVRMFRQALGPGSRVIATDMSPIAPGLYAADSGFLMPRIDKPEFLSRLLELCRQESISAIIPLLDPELTVLAAARETFAQQGVTVLVASPEMVHICEDKLLTTSFLTNIGVPVPRTFTDPESALQSGIPLIVKPRRGSAANDVHSCFSSDELHFWWLRVPGPMIQQRLSGDEITIDVLSDLNGKPLVQVQRQRLKVRAGEVERGITVHYPEIADYALRIAAALKAPGVINIQCFFTDSGPRFTEINPRFGGGYPLAHAAGAGFPERIVQMLRGDRAMPPLGIRTGVVMMRYDEAIYRETKELLDGNHGTAS